jgi:hypothetical protein
MAQLEIGKLIYSITSKVDGRFQANLKKSEKQALKTGQAMGKASSRTRGFGAAFGQLRTGALAAVAALAGVGVAIGRTITAYNEQERAEARLAQIATQVTGATREQIEEYKELASELQSVGVVGDEVIIAGQSQIASFTKNAEVVKLLTKDIADLTVATYGANVSQEQAIQTANNLGRALTGQLGALTRTGILVSDEYKVAFEAANTELERAIILSQIIQDNYGGLNEALAETSEGRLVRLRNAFGDLSERIGEAFIPALENVIASLQKGAEGAVNSGDELTGFAKVLFRVSGAFNVLGATVGNIAQAINIGWNGVVSAFQTGGIVILSAVKAISGALGNDTSNIDAAMLNLETKIIDRADNIAEAFSKIKENGEAIDEGLRELVFAEGFTGAGGSIAADKALQQAAELTQTLGDETTEAGEKTEEAEKQLAEWERGLIRSRDAARETSKALSGELGDSFDKFSEGIRNNLQETNRGLADIVIEAEDRRKELRAALKDTDDRDERRSIRDELKDVEEIFKAERGFEKRREEEFTAIREQLAEAGIDAAEVGLDKALEVRSVEEEIEEKRRVAALDEFSRFEEQQLSKLRIIVDNFVQETKLLEGKIETQKKFEADLTNFMKLELDTRQGDIDAFASVAIAKYGEVARSLESLLSQQAQAADLPNALGGSVGAAGLSSLTGGAQVPNSLSSTVRGISGALGNTTNTTISPTVNIGGGSQLQNLSANELSAILGFELNKYIK